MLSGIARRIDDLADLVGLLTTRRAIPLSIIAWPRVLEACRPGV
jgi:hypothetical protein